jgi:hypothetical protein
MAMGFTLPLKHTLYPCFFVTNMAMSSTLAQLRKVPAGDCCGLLERELHLASISVVTGKGTPRRQNKPHEHRNFKRGDDGQ